MRQSQALRELSLAQTRLKEVEGQASLGLSAAVIGIGILVTAIGLTVLFTDKWWFLAGVGGLLFAVGTAVYINLHSRTTYRDEFGDKTFIYGHTALELARMRVAQAEKDLEESE